MPKRYWLMKVEPEAYSIDEWQRDGETSWEGVRNYQARNSLRDDFQVGDGVLFYQSNAKPTGVAGIGTVSRAGYPDASAWTKGHNYFDPKASPDNPIWYRVDIKFQKKFPGVVSLEQLKTTAGLEQMLVIKRGMRLSIQPCTKAEFDIVSKLGAAAKPEPTAPAKAKAKKKKSAAKKPVRKRK